MDPDTPSKALRVHVYFNGPAGAKGAHGVNVGYANRYRADLCKAIKSCKHGFATPVPVGLRDNTVHQAYAYTFDSKTAKPVALKNFPRAFNCKPPSVPLGPAASRRRWVTGPTSFAAWKMSYLQIYHLTSAQAAAYTKGKPMPAAPALVRASGKPEVWLLDAGQRRHVLSTASMSSWGLTSSMVKVWPLSQVTQYPQGRSCPRPAWPRSSREGVSTCWTPSRRPRGLPRRTRACHPCRI